MLWCRVFGCVSPLLACIMFLVETKKKTSNGGPGIYIYISTHRHHTLAYIIHWHVPRTSNKIQEVYVREIFKVNVDSVQLTYVL